jgi:hypothetical protein
MLYPFELRARVVGKPSLIYSRIISYGEQPGQRPGGRLDRFALPCVQPAKLCQRETFWISVVRVLDFD